MSATASIVCGRDSTYSIQATTFIVDKAESAAASSAHALGKLYAFMTLYQRQHGDSWHHVHDITSRTRRRLTFMPHSQQLRDTRGYREQ